MKSVPHKSSNNRKNEKPLQSYEIKEATLSFINLNKKKKTGNRIQTADKGVKQTDEIC